MSYSRSPRAVRSMTVGIIGMPGSLLAAPRGDAGRWTTCTPGGRVQSSRICEEGRRRGARGLPVTQPDARRSTAPAGLRRLGSAMPSTAAQ